MALESETVVIGDTTYQIGQLGSLAARKTLVRLTKSLGPVLGTLLAEVGLEPSSMTSEGLEGGISNMSVKAIGALANSLAEHLTEADLEYLCETFGKVSFYMVDGKRLQLTLERQELHFKGGNLLNLFKWLGACLKVNYADFFTGWGKATPPQPQPGVGATSE